LPFGLSFGQGGLMIALYVYAVLYILAGLNHFRVPKFYLHLMPPYIPAHRLMVLLSGVAEVALGILLLFPVTRSLAAIGIILMLLVFMTVHIYMLQERNGKFASIPSWILWARIPGQALLTCWAWLYI